MNLGGWLKEVECFFLRGKGLRGRFLNLAIFLNGFRVEFLGGGVFRGKGRKVKCLKY